MKTTVTYLATSQLLCRADGPALEPINFSGTRRQLWGWLLAVLLMAAALQPAQALQGATGVHDPSTIVKRNGVYHIWGTGNQIHHMTSTDLVNWTVAPTVFAAGTWPSWINTYVPNFGGNFWAPECVFMNGQYYLYYSCSMGDRASAIGVATSPDLTTWTDQGMVVYSDNATIYGSIDPAVVADGSGNYWMSFGSHLTGIWIAQLNPLTGKRLNAVVKNIAGSTVSEHEAPYIIRNGNYYYLFYNRGVCCAGTNSTYYVQMGRSTTPDGAYVDRSGLNLLNGGGTTVLSSSGTYYGPGHIGLFQENGTNYVTHHYYDGFENGLPKLSIANLQWDAAQWPVISRDWVASGRYQIISRNNSSLVWDAWGCTGVAGQAIAQGTNANLTCQQWDLAAQGNGEYVLTNAVGGLAAEVTNCSPYLGARLRLNPYTGLLCQRFRLERTNDGSYVLASLNSNRVVEVPNASQTAGVQLGLWDYNGCFCQRWTLSAPIALAATNPALLTGVRIFPVPANDGNFTVELGPETGTAPAQVEILNLQGQRVYRQEFSHREKLAVAAALRPGIYLVRVSTGSSLITQKINVL